MASMLFPIHHWVCFPAVSSRAADCHQCQSDFPPTQKVAMGGCVCWTGLCSFPSSDGQWLCRAVQEVGSHQQNAGYCFCSLTEHVKLGGP